MVPLHSNLLNFHFPFPPAASSIMPLLQDLGSSDACRIVIQLHTKNIPGNPQLRHMNVANAFLQEYYSRDFLQDTDYVHTPAQIDAPDTKCWVMIDINISQHSGKPLDDIPLYSFAVEFSGPVWYVL
jgi:hypothetical protein